MKSGLSPDQEHTNLSGVAPAGHHSWTPSHMRALRNLIGLTASSVAFAQAPHWHNVSPVAANQIQDVEAAMMVLALPDSARAAGFRPILGWIPTMGTHWVSAPRML